MAMLERYMFYYMDTITQKRFAEALELVEQMRQMADEQIRPLLDGYAAAAQCLEALKMGEFDVVEELWGEFEASTKLLDPHNSHYAILAEINLILENIKEEIERII
jgi:hypothetical protein